jgi:hypothetical protein
MKHWTQAIYEATGIPVDEEDLALALRDGTWQLLLYQYPVLAVGSDPDPGMVTPAIGGALSRAMEQRLSKNVRRVQHLLESINARGARDVDIRVLNADGDVSYVGGIESGRGWPHFVLQLTAGGFDVAIDLDPYTPDEPFDLEDLRQQAEVILQVVDLTG